MAEGSSGVNATAVIAIMVLVLFSVFFVFRYMGGSPKSSPSLNVAVPNPATGNR